MSTVAWWHLENRVYASRTQYRALVVTAAGSEPERELHRTVWHSDPHTAVSEAEIWMRIHGIVHGADAGA
jgi:hypothetical protein